MRGSRSAPAETTADVSGGYSSFMREINPLDIHGLQTDARVVVAMSGGVDSSVVAAVLKHYGCDVIGVTLQLYDHGEAISDSKSCCAGRDIADARRVADMLDIPHYVLDYEARFREHVMDDFAESYLAGETPIPCISCNQNIKFMDLLQTASELGADTLATGHYVRSRFCSNGWQLHSAIDAERDQSYFLFTMTRKKLASVRFPLGGLMKTQVRQLANEFDLPVADKADSQDICFVPGGRYARVIERLRPGAVEAGNIVHVDGDVIGRHPGIINFTIGQRRGLGVAAGSPLYVVRIDAERHQVVVGPREYLRTQRILLRDLNWLGDNEVKDATADGFDVCVKIRSTQPPRPATLSIENGVAVVDLREGEYGVSPGQACVFYDGSRMLGGGWIASADMAIEIRSMPGRDEKVRRKAYA